jgi:hypothetical protein
LTSLAVPTPLLLLQSKEVHCTRNFNFNIHVRNVATLEWHMESRKFGMTAAELERLQEKSVEV